MEYEFTRIEFVADAIINFMREGHRPSDDEVIFLDCSPLIDMLRRKIEDSDVPWILRVVESASEPVASFACNLLRKHLHQSDVKTCFEARWTTAESYLKIRLMWRMLDDPNLSRDWHECFFNFILTEWDTFRDFNLMFYEPQEIIHRVLSRIGDSSYPESKKWIYLCCIPEVVEDCNAAKALIDLVHSIRDPFSEDVAEALQERFFTNHREKIDKEKGKPGEFCSEKKEALVLDFVADAIMRYLRDGHQPSEEEAACLNRLPIIDMLRSRVELADIAQISQVVERESGEIAGFFLSLLRRYAPQRGIQFVLRKKWHEADAFLRAHLLWRILDDPNLPLDWHHRIFDFIFEAPTNREMFKEVAKKFMGSQQTLVINFLKRLTDPSFPDSKKWALLCSISEIVEDRPTARMLITLGRNMGNSFAQEVADQLLETVF